MDYRRFHPAGHPTQAAGDISLTLRLQLRVWLHRHMFIELVFRECVQTCRSGVYLVDWYTTAVEFSWSSSETAADPSETSQIHYVITHELYIHSERHRSGIDVIGCVGETQPTRKWSPCEFFQYVKTLQFTYKITFAHILQENCKVITKGKGKNSQGGHSGLAAS